MKNALSTIALLVLAVPAVATAQPPAARSAPALSIRYADLNLSDPRDADTMLHRIRATAVEMCQPGETGFEATGQFEACYRRTVSESVAKLNAPRVTAAFQAKARTAQLARLP